MRDRGERRLLSHHRQRAPLCLRGASSLLARIRFDEPVGPILGRRREVEGRREPQRAGRELPTLFLTPRGYSEMALSLSLGLDVVVSSRVSGC